MFTSINDKQQCDAKSSNSGNMDSLPYNSSGTQDGEFFTQPRPQARNLSKLAELISRIEYKPKHQQSSSSTCKDYGQTFPNLDNLVDHQEGEHVLQKLHCCQRCGQKFALLSSLQLHKCPSPSPMCQTCREKPQWDSACPNCGTDPSGECLSEEPFYRDNSPYACALCGQAFSHKQELLYHQQAGGCQPAPLSPSPPSTPLPPSLTCKRVSSSTCTECSRTFRSAAAFGSHLYFFHRKRKNILKKASRVSQKRFPCRSCDKVFTQTSLLYRHRKEEHRREVMARNSGATRGRKDNETYPCLHCGKVFLHHLTRWAHFKHFSAHHQGHLALSSKSTKAVKVSSNSLKEGKHLKRGRPKKLQPDLTDKQPEVKTDDQAMPKASEKVHQSADTCRCCSVCTGEINLSDTPVKGRSNSFKKGKPLKRGRPKKLQPVLTDKQPEVKTDDQITLQANEKVHQSADTCRCCSVCTGEINLSDIHENCEKNIYHCVPCAEAFIDLETFLEHCKKHLIREHEEDEDLLSD